jgi:hypothetical protein
MSTLGTLFASMAYFAMSTLGTLFASMAYFAMSTKRL